MNLFRIAGASTIGTSHIENEMPCQDKFFSKKSKNVAAISLADGAGSCSKSDIGAEICSRYIVDFLCNNFDKSFLKSELEVSEEILKGVNKYLQNMSDELNAPLIDFSSTLLFVAAKGNKFIAGHIGDGLIGSFDESGSQIFSPPENGEFSNQTFFITMGDAKDHLRIYKGNLNSTLGFILMSDGSYESLFDTQKNELTDANLTFFSWLVDKKNSIQTIEKSLEDALINKFTQKTIDDCSIILLSTKQVDGWLNKVKEIIHFINVEKWWEKIRK